MTTISAALGTARLSRRVSRRRRLQPSTHVVLGLLAALVLVAVFGPLLAPHSPNAADPVHRLAGIGSPATCSGRTGKDATS